MSSPNPDFKDELGDLIQRTLDSQVGSPEPAETIWSRIAHRLAQKPALGPFRRRSIFASPVIQVVLILFIIIIGGFSLQTASMPGEEIPVQQVASLRQPAEQPKTGRYVDEYSVSSPPAVIPGRLEIQMMKDYQRKQTRDISLQGQPIIMAPLDVSPHPLSAEGRFLNAKKAEPAQVVPVLDQVMTHRFRGPID